MHLRLVEMVSPSSIRFRDRPRSLLRPRPVCARRGLVPVRHRPVGRDLIGALLRQLPAKPAAVRSRGRLSASLPRGVARLQPARRIGATLPTFRTRRIAI